MAINKSKKAQIIDFLRTKVTIAPSLAFVNLHGLPVTQATALRKKLKTAGLGMFVAKKTLLRRALAETKITGELPVLDGEVGVVYLTPEANDQLAPAREVYAFGKSHKGLEENLKLLGGVFAERYVDAAYAKELAVIPSREQLYGQLLSLLQSPIRSLLVGLQAIANRPAV